MSKLNNWRPIFSSFLKFHPLPFPEGPHKQLQFLWRSHWYRSPGLLCFQGIRGFSTLGLLFSCLAQALSPLAMKNGSLPGEKSCLYINMCQTLQQPSKVSSLAFSFPKVLLNRKKIPAEVLPFCHQHWWLQPLLGEACPYTSVFRSLKPKGQDIVGVFLSLSFPDFLGRLRNQFSLSFISMAYCIWNRYDSPLA